MIGLDIGSRYIKLCAVQGGNGRYAITSAVLAANPASLANARVSETADHQIRMMVKKAGLSSRDTAASMGGMGVVARDFSFPALSRQELVGAVKLEAEQSIFSDLSTMYTDYLVLDRSANEVADVLFVAAPKDSVDQRAQIIKSAGLELAMMDIDNLALANAYLAFEPSAAQSAVVLLNIGHSHTNIVILDSGQLRLVRNVDAGGKNIAREIAAQFHTTPAIAEELMKQPALWPEMGLNIKNILRKSIPQILEAVYRSMEYCMSRNKIINIDAILVTGGVSALEGLEPFVSEILGIPVRKWNPLDALTFEGTARKELGQFMGVALGLALRR